MAKKIIKRKGAARPTVAPAAPAAPSSDDIASALGALGSAIDHSNELGYLMQLEYIADNLGTAAGELDAIGKALAAHVIATHGTEQDRAQIVNYLKGWFSNTGAFHDR